MKVLQQSNALKTLMTAMAIIMERYFHWWRYGSQFAEPYKNDSDGSRKDITKQIFNLTYSSGDKYGSNFFTYAQSS